MNQDEYKMVGVDADGKPLYQKVEQEAKGPVDQTNIPASIIETNQEGSQNLAESRRKPELKGARARMASLDGICEPSNSDFLYQELDPELVRLRHEQSQEQFPDIKLFEKEFVLKVIHRHPIGVAVIWLVSALITTLLVGIWAMLIIQNSSSNVIHQDLFSMSTGMIIIGSIVAIALIFAVIFSRVYRANKLIITTERVVQIISNSLFDTKRQTIDLGWIEDVSYHQKGFFASTIGYGSVRLSTIGDETTYYFVFAPNPQQITMRINEIVFAVKNERPLTEKQIKQV